MEGPAATTTMTALHTSLRAALLACAAGAVAMPASAQYYYGPGYGSPGYGPPPGYYSYNAPPPPGREYGRAYDDEEYPPPRAPRPISARTVADRLEDMGYDDVGRPRFTGTLYIVEATGPGGVRQQIVVDAIRGIILNRTAIGGGPPIERGEGEPPRRYGGRTIDTDDLHRDPGEGGTRAAPRRRESARSGPIETTPVPPADPSSLPPPADPRLAPEAPQRSAPRPFEGRREARTEPRRNGEPRESGARPFGLNPVPPPGAASKAKEGEERKAGKPAAPAPRPVAEARPKPDKPVRMIQGVTPLNNGESRSQLDNLPSPPEPASPTGD